MDRMEVEEWRMSRDATEAQAISTFTADVKLQVVYWVDSLSKKIWSSKLSDTDHRLVCQCALHRRLVNESIYETN